MSFLLCPTARTYHFPKLRVVYILLDSLGNLFLRQHPTPDKGRFEDTVVKTVQGR